MIGVVRMAALTVVLAFVLGMLLFVVVWLLESMSA